MAGRRRKSIVRERRKKSKCAVTEKNKRTIRSKNLNLSGIIVKTPTPN